MSMQEYKEMSGVRFYQGNDARVKRPTLKSDDSLHSLGKTRDSGQHVKVVEMNIDSAPDRNAISKTVSRQEARRLFPQKGFTHMEKNLKGKIHLTHDRRHDTDSLSGSLSQTRQSNYQSDYVCNMLVDDKIQSNEYNVADSKPVTVSTMRSRYSKTEAVPTNAHVSIDSNMSTNPMRHNYARVLDLKLNA